MNKLSLPHERGLVVFNPLKATSRRFVRAQKQLIYASEMYDLPLTYLSTEADRQHSKYKIQEALRANDLMIVAGGDGTLNVAADGLVASSKEAVRLIAIPQGSANDFARIHSGKMSGQRAISALLERDHQVVIHPLMVSVDDDDTVRTFMAVNNAGFNYTADFAQRLDSTDHRTSRLRNVPLVGQITQELRSVVSSLADLKTFSCFESGETEPRQLLDRTLVHSAKAGKYGRFAVNHTSNYFLDIVNSQPTRMSIAKAAVQMALGVAPAERRTSIAFNIGEEPILGHVDGEVFAITPNSRITAELSDKSFTAYSQ